MAAYSVGQQIAIAVFTALVGLGAVVFIFRFRSFREVLHAGRASREAERAAGRWPLLKALAGLAHERHGLGEHARDHRADLLGLRLGVALQVHPLRRRRRSCRRRA